MIRYALVGLGHISQTAVLPAFAGASRNSCLVALVSGDLDKRTALAARYGVEATFGYDEYERCLTGVDAVYLALPNHLHATYAIRAAQAGIHVLCEKPLALTTGECVSTIEACRDRDVRLMVAHRLRHDAMTRELVDRVAAGAIGEPRYFDGVFSFTVRPGDPRTGPTVQGGGTLYDIGVYGINAARRVFGAEPVEATALAVAASAHAADETTASVLRFPAGRLAVFTTSFAAAGLGAYRIVGTEGHVRAEPGFAYSGELAYELCGRGGTERRAFAAGNQFADQILHFSDCILNHRTPDSPGEDGLADVRAVEALLTSAATGRATPIGSPNGRPAELRGPRV